MNTVTKTDQVPEYRYVEVRNLASCYLPSSRTRDAQKVDRMLADRDERISALERELANKEAAVERYMHENARLRAFIGQERLDIKTALDAIDVARIQLCEAMARNIPAPPRPAKERAS